MRTTYVIMLVMVTVYMITSNTLAALPNAHGNLSSDMFASSNKCAQCHAITYEQWKGTMHYNAYEDPFYQKEVLAASSDTQGIVDEFCSRCHTPIGVVSGEIPPIDGSGLSSIAREGVQCDICHVISGSNGTGNAPFVVSPGNVKWGPFDDSKSAYHGSKYLELYTTSEYCGMCHYVTHPLNGLVVDDTYTVWKEGPYAKEGVVCQDCHMTSGITKFVANPGRAGSGAKKREHISTHEIVGGNAFIPEVLGEKGYGKMAAERLEKAATLSIDSLQMGQRGDNISLNISITNSGAGHKIPTGVSEIRQMWLAVRVKDASGRQVYNTGDVNANGTVGDAKIYNTVLGDAQGQPTLSFWLAQSILEDNRIPPRGTVSEKHTFRIPDDVTYPLALDATLKYRSAPQDLIDHLFGEKVHEVPVLSIAEMSVNIYEDGETSTETTIPATPGVGILGTATILLCAAHYYMERRKI